MTRRHSVGPNSEFQRIMRHPPLSSRLLLVFALPNDRSGFRLGVAVSSRLKGAVRRNRAKRRLREAARLTLQPFLGDYDVILLARQALESGSWQALEAELTRVRELIGRR